MLLKQADRKLGLTRSVAQCIPDARRQASVTHTMRQMIACQVFGIACGSARWAYLLCDHIRRTALQNTRLARATSATIRNKLIRIGAVVLRNTRRIRLHLSSACPHQDLFALAATRLE